MSTLFAAFAAIAHISATRACRAAGPSHAIERPRVDGVEAATRTGVARAGRIDATCRCHINARVRACETKRVARRVGAAAHRASIVFVGERPPPDRTEGP